MIKGKFIATIEIDITIDENTQNLLPFEKLKEECGYSLDKWYETKEEAIEAGNRRAGEEGKHLAD